MLQTRTCHQLGLAAVVVSVGMAGTPAPLEGQSTPQQNRSRKFGPGECGPVDPSYIQLANETGGQPFFLNPSEVAKAFHFVRESSGSHWICLTTAMISSRQSILMNHSSTSRKTNSSPVRQQCG